MSLKKITIALSIAFFISLIAMIYFLYYNPLPNDTEGKIKVEVIKYLMQLMVVVILGSIVAVLFKAEEISRKEKEFQEEKQIEIRNDFMKRLSKFYYKIKFVRRTMRAGGLTTKYGKMPDKLTRDQILLYKNQIEIINEVQLGIEEMKLEIENFNELIFQGVSGNMSKMERYLAKILDEFEITFPLFDINQSISFEQLKCLKEFTDSTKDGDISLFKSNLSNPYYSAIKTLSHPTK